MKSLHPSCLWPIPFLRRGCPYMGVAGELGLCFLLIRLLCFSGRGWDGTVGSYTVGWFFVWDCPKHYRMFSIPRFYELNASSTSQVIATTRKAPTRFRTPLWTKCEYHLSDTMFLTTPRGAAVPLRTAGSRWTLPKKPAAFLQAHFLSLLLPLPPGS